MFFVCKFSGSKSNRRHFSEISNAFINLDAARFGHADFRTATHSASVCDHWNVVISPFGVGRSFGCVSAKRMRGREWKEHVKNKLLHQNEKDYTIDDEY